MQSESHLKSLLKKAESQVRIFNNILSGIANQIEKLQRKKSQIEYMLSVRMKEVSELKNKIQEIKDTQISEIKSDNWKYFI